MALSRIPLGSWSSAQKDMESGIRGLKVRVLEFGHPSLGVVSQSLKGNEQNTFKAPILHEKQGHFYLTFPSPSVTSFPSPHECFHLPLSPSRSLILVFSGHRLAHLELHSE